MIPSITDMALSHGPRPISPEAKSLLDQGDITGLLALKKVQFPGGFSMKEDDSDDDTDDDDNDDGDDDDDDTDDDEEKSDEQKRIDELNAENARRRKKASQQARRIKELEAEVAKSKKAPAKKAAAKEGDEAEVDDEKVTELSNAVDSLTKTNEDLLIRLEFTNLVTGEEAKHKFKNPAKALRLLDLDEVEITDKGEIEGLEDAIADLAKSDPYLLVDDKNDDEDDEDDEDKEAKRKTGRKTGNRRRKGSGQPNRDALLKKYPALRR